MDEAIGLNHVSCCPVFRVSQSLGFIDVWVLGLGLVFKFFSSPKDEASSIKLVLCCRARLDQTYQPLHNPSFSHSHRKRSAVQF